MTAAAPTYRIANDRFRERFDSLPDKLRSHIYRVRDVGLELASRHDIDEERAELAVLGHDVARAAKKNEILRLADSYGMSTLDIERRSPVTLHGPSAQSCFVKRTVWRTRKYWRQSAGTPPATPVSHRWVF